MMAIKRGEHFCPKFLGLPDMIKYSLPAVSTKLLTHDIKTESDNIASLKCYEELAEPLGCSKVDIKSALREAEKVWLSFRQYSKGGFSLADAMDLSLGLKKENQMTGVRDRGDVKIGVIGYVYDIYDNFVSMNIIDKLKSMDVGIQTFEMVDEKVLSKQLRGMGKVLFWTFSNKIFEAGYSFFRDEEIDGIIQVTAFGCGPDSLIGKIMEFESNEYKKPFMTVRVDEHTGENHLQTRVEAFCDMIRRKKAQVERGA